MYLSIAVAEESRRKSLLFLQNISLTKACPWRNWEFRGYFCLQPEAFGCILEAFHVGFQGLLNLLHRDTNCKREPGRDRKILSNHKQDDNVGVAGNGNLAS